MTKTWIMPWHSNSVGAAFLAKLGGWNLLIGSEWFGSEDAVIHWGVTSQPLEGMALNINKRSHWYKTDKEFLSKISAVPVSKPDLTTNLKEAFSWLQEGKEVLGFPAKQPQAVFFSDDPGAWAGSQYWTHYRKKTAEYLVHVAFGKVFYLEEIVPRKTHPTTGEELDPSDFDFRIRSRRNGFVTRPASSVPEAIEKDALTVLEATKLDFGCFRFLWNKVTQRHFLLSREPSPLLTEELAGNYVRVLQERIDTIA